MTIYYMFYKTKIKERPFFHSLPMFYWQETKNRGFKLQEFFQYYGTKLY